MLLQMDFLQHVHNSINLDRTSSRRGDLLRASSFRASAARAIAPGHRGDREAIRRASAHHDRGITSLGRVTCFYAGESIVIEFR